MEESKKKLGQEPAFSNEYHQGMSTRFYAACMAVSGIMANPNSEPTRPIHFTNIVADAYKIADELLRQEEL